MDINNAYEFFKNVKLTADGYLIVSGSGGGGATETVEITINNNLYKIINAPNIEDIKVLDQYGDPVGTITGGALVVQIPQFIKPDISINSTPYKEYNSGDIDNIKVKDENGNEVGSLVNGEWIVPSGGSGPVYIKSVVLGSYNIKSTIPLVIYDIFDNGDIARNNNYRTLITGIETGENNMNTSTDINPTTGTIIMCGGGGGDDDYINYSNTHRRSTDNGKTWFNFPNFNNSNSEPVNMGLSVYFEESTSNWYLYTSTEPAYKINTYSTINVWISRDDGLTWSEIFSENTYRVSPRVDQRVGQTNLIGKVNNEYYWTKYSTSSSQIYLYGGTTIEDSMSNYEVVKFISHGSQMQNTGLCYGNINNIDIYILYTYSNTGLNTISVSNDGVNYNTVTNGSVYRLSSIVFDSNREEFVALGSDEQYYYVYSYTSIDGINWVQGEQVLAKFLGNSIQATNTLYYDDYNNQTILFGLNIMKSSDNINWEYVEYSGTSFRNSVRERDLSGLM